VSTQQTDPMIGRLIDGRYQVRSRIARGGMATVYLATDLRLERLVAVKIMHDHLADDTQFTERFIQEARSAARLAHPNVVNVFDQGQDADSAYLVMEYLPGITLRDLLEEYGSLTSEQTIDIVEAVLAGLAAAHRAGIVHRDLKPENVMLADDGRIKIGDFGLARAATTQTATGAALLGTIAYLSPELVTRGVADTRSDIYAVGIMMYEMLAGEQPFKGEQPMQIAYQHANDSVPPPSAKNPAVPAELDELVLWATARDPEQRPRDAREMLDQLRDTAASLTSALPSGATAVQRTMVLPTLAAANPDAATQVIGRVAPTTETAVTDDSTTALAATARKRRRGGWWLFAIVVVLAAVAGGAGWWFGSGPGSQVAIPASIASATPEQATATLEDLGLVVASQTGTTTDPQIAEGLVANTDPAIGTMINRGSTITLLLSVGPKQLALPALVGMQEDAAHAAIEGQFQLADVEYRFTENAAGEVLDVLGADGATSIAGQPEYGEQQPLSLIVSVGPIPDVSGLKVDDAIDRLADANLVGTVGGSEFSDSIKRDRIIRAQPKNDPVRPGDEVTLIQSLGVEQVEVPNVEGLGRDKAVEKLEALGFKVTYNPFFKLVNGVATGTDPEAGKQVDKGSTVNLFLQFSG
jgi:beta-lactam-binding protein with PASTA domain/tRNA A-37 threonylcarbamoyl transferase component Bud32